MAVGVSSSALNIYDCTSVTDLVIPAVNVNLFSAFFQSSLKVAFPPIATYILLQVGNYSLTFFKLAWISHLFMFLLLLKTTPAYKNSQLNFFQSSLLECHSYTGGKNDLEKFKHIFVCIHCFVCFVTQLTKYSFSYLKAGSLVPVPAREYMSTLFLAIWVLMLGTMTYLWSPLIHSTCYRVPNAGITPTCNTHISL